MVIKDKDMVFDASTHMACINLYQTEPSNKMESEKLQIKLEEYHNWNMVDNNRKRVGHMLYKQNQLIWLKFA